MRRPLLALAAAAVSIAAASPPASGGGPITPGDIMALRDVRDAEISPDGHTVLFTVQRQVATFAPEHATIWSVPADGSAPARPFIVSAGADGEPHWSPDGQSVAFLSNRKNPLSGGADTGFEFKRDTASTPGVPIDAAPPPDAAEPGEPSRQIWLIRTDGGEAVPLTAPPGDVSDLAWSPDGTRIAFLSADPETSVEKADRAAKRDWTEVDRIRHVTRLWVLDVATHFARLISPETVNVSAMDWSPDGRQLAVRVADTASINDSFYHSRIVTLDPATGRLGPTLLDHVASAPSWSPDGRSILADQVLTPGFIGVAPRIYHLATGRTDRLGDAYPGLLSDLKWTADGRGVLALSFERTRSNLVRLEIGRAHV